jgi:hypothetical protein
MAMPVSFTPVKGFMRVNGSMPVKSFMRVKGFMPVKRFISDPSNI